MKLFSNFFIKTAKASPALNTYISSFSNNKLNFTILFFDVLLIIIFISFLFHDIFVIISNILNYFNNLYSIESSICNMTSINNNNGGSNTSTSIIHSNDGWAQGIKSIFVYGTGALRLQLLRSGGTPLQRGFVITSTVVADAASTGLKNAINDPEYVEKHINSWSRVLKGDNSSTLELNIDKDIDTLNKLKDVKNSLISDNVNGLSENITNSIINYLKPILEPVSVNYSNEVLANQIYGVSILLFILSLMILILLLAFIINIFIFVYSDKIMNLFTNKYIRWYIAFNKKIIGIEICFLGGSLLYFMYYLSYGIHFIATHPITFN